MPETRTHPLKVGIFLPFAEYMMDKQTPRWRDLLAMAQRAEALTIIRFPEPEDLFGGHTTAGTWECWSVLAALAASTERIELGPLVACTGFHNPALLAKQADTIDEISGGRLVLGLGAGWLESDYSAFGYPYDHRVSRFEEALTIIRTLLRDGHIDYEGTYFRARECELRPRGPRASGPPILIGSVGSRMLRLAARHADQWNGWIIDRSSPGEVPALRTAVDEACAEVGRDPSTLVRTVGISVDSLGRSVNESSGTLTGPPEVLAEMLRAFAREGISHIQIMFEPSTLASIEAFALALELLDRA